jgi:hypothetical protein
MKTNALRAASLSLVLPLLAACAAPKPGREKKTALQRYLESQCELAQSARSDSKRVFAQSEVPAVVVAAAAEQIARRMASRSPGAAELKSFAPNLKVDYKVWGLRPHELDPGWWVADVDVSGRKESGFMRTMFLVAVSSSTGRAAFVMEGGVETSSRPIDAPSGVADPYAVVPAGPDRPDAVVLRWVDRFGSLSFLSAYEPYVFGWQKAASACGSRSAGP